MLTGHAGNGMCNMVQAAARAASRCRWYGPCPSVVLDIMQAAGDAPMAAPEVAVLLLTWW